MNPSTAITLPSRKGLLLRLLLSVLVAVVILFGFILPAEFQIDPTGFGRATGLAQMGQTGPANTAIAHTYSGSFRTDEVDLTLAPNEEYEYKVKMNEGGTLVYSWTSEGPYEFDFHGEADADPEHAVSYTAGSGAVSHGSLIAPFKGIHGWYWKNQAKSFNKIHLKMAGQYELTVDFSE